MVGWGVRWLLIVGPRTTKAKSARTRIAQSKEQPSWPTRGRFRRAREPRPTKRIECRTKGNTSRQRPRRRPAIGCRPISGRPARAFGGDGGYVLIHGDVQRRATTDRDVVRRWIYQNGRHRTGLSIRVSRSMRMSAIDIVTRTAFLVSVTEGMLPVSPI